MARLSSFRVDLDLDLAPAARRLIALCLAIGGLGSAATMPEIKGWYAGLIKPSFNPPNWIFGPVWSTLYVLMACSANAAWTDSQARRTFFIILLVNSLWSLLFFGMHRPDLALIDILGYLILLIIWIRQLWPQHRVAAQHVDACLLHRVDEGVE